MGLHSVMIGADISLDSMVLQIKLVQASNPKSANCKVWESFKPQFCQYSNQPQSRGLWGLRLMHHQHHGIQQNSSLMLFRPFGSSPLVSRYNLALA